MKKLFLLSFALICSLISQADSLVTLPTGVTAEDYTLIGEFQVLNNTTKEFEKKSRSISVKVAFNGSDVYLAGLSYNFPNAYVKGTIEGNMATFASGQLVGETLFQSFYLCGIILQAGAVANNDFILSYSAENRSFSYNAGVGIMIAEANVANATKDEDLISFVSSASLSPGAMVDTPVEAPENLSTDNYMFTATYMRYEKDDNQQDKLVTEDYQSSVKVGFNGDDLYIQGISEYAPNGWAKATKNSQGQYVVPAGQYMAFVDVMGLGQLIRHYYIAAIDNSGNLTDLVFNYDSQTGNISTSQIIIINSAKEAPAPYNYYRNVSFKKMIEKEATPSKPTLSFSAAASYSGLSTEYMADIFVSLLDTEGNPMMSDKVSFQFLRVKDGVEESVVFPASKYRNLQADAVELPYGFTDGFDFSSHTIYFDPMGVDELKTWTKLGMQTIYRGNGIEHRSEIVWFDLAAFWQAMATSIDNVSAKTADVRYGSYDLQGRKAGVNTKGLVIERVRNAHGSIAIRKVMKR